MRQRRLRWWHVGLAFAGIIAVAAIGLGWKVLRVGSTVFGGSSNASPLEQLGRLVVPGDRELRHDGKHRTNILLVGHGGEGHEGPYLADTIILASLHQTTQEVAMLSIPRDFLVELPGFGYRKINNALAFGRTSTNPEGGDALITKAVEEVTGQPVHYFARVDFNGFKKAVDDVGGIDVTVDTPFVDYEYPTYNFGYQTIRFDAGTHHLNGEQALQFSRSRHGTNGEGSDFARSKRQQKLLFAFREKALSKGTLTNLRKVNELLDTLGGHVRTNLELWEVMRFAGVAKELSVERVVTRVLETSPNSLVRESNNGAYIIQPRLGLGNYQEIQELSANIFQYNSVAKEAVPVQVQNATSTTGLADSVGQTLAGFAFDIRSIASPKVRYEQSVIVDLSGGRAPQTVAALQQRYQATVTTELPAELVGTQALPFARNTNADQPPTVVLVLGRSAAAIVNSEKLMQKNPSSST